MAKMGGRRPGAGRKPHSKTIKRVSPEVINAGILPLEMRLRVARKLWMQATDKAGEITDLEKAKEAATFAEAALPYTSPRLNSIEHTGANGGPIKTEDVRTRVANEIDELIAKPHVAAVTQAPTRH